MNDLMTVAHLIGIDNVVLCGETINEGELHLTEINQVNYIRNCLPVHAHGNLKLSITYLYWVIMVEHPLSNLCD